MYEYIKGRLHAITPTYAVIDCNGVGYHLNISLHTYTAVKEKTEVLLYAHLAIKEDAHTLFGFAEDSERELFRLLISVSGVGAATARMILSSLTPHEVERAITSADVITLKKIKGIGAKTAERIIIDLRDKMGKVALSGLPNITTPKGTSSEAALALVALGFTKSLADKAIDKAIQDNGENQKVEDLIKQALKYL